MRRGVPKRSALREGVDRLGSVAWYTSEGIGWLGKELVLLHFRASG